jgi:uncharacterized repeat protein (TIGR02543 family)
VGDEMAFEYSFKLNGVELYATLGANTIDKLEEAMDETAFHIPITVLDFEYKMFGLLQVEIKDDNDDTLTFDYLIMSDEVTVLSKDGWYSHSVTAIEYTHKLDKYLVNTLTFTKPFSRKVRAPFEYLNGFDIITPQTYMKAILPRVEINEFHTVGEEIIVKSVGVAKYPDPLYGSANSEFFDKDVYIRVDSESYHNLTVGDFEYTFTTGGYRTITVGVIIDESDPFDVQLLPMYQYYITVFDDKKYTLYDVLTIIRETIPIESKFYHTYSGLRLFDIDTNLVDEFKKIEMPQMFIQHQTVRQVLNTIFKYINAISRLKYIDDGADTLTIDKFNKIVGDLSITNQIDFSSSQDVQSYATKAISWLENSLQDNFRENPSIKTPATSKFKTVRATNVQLLNVAGNFHLKLERTIHELSKFEMIIPEILRSGVSYTNKVIDFTARAIEKRWWDLKDIDVNFPSYTPTLAFHSQIGKRTRRGGNIYWERNKKSIDFSFVMGDYIKDTLLMEMIQEALNEEITLEPEIKQTGDLIDFTFQTSTYVTDDVGSNDLFRNIGFNVEYITLENPTHQSERLDISNINYTSDLRVNQTARQTDFNRASRNAFGQLQRSGTPNVSFTKVHTSIGDIYDLGMITEDNYILTQRSLSLYNEHIRATYTLTLDHNRLNEFNGINQEYRVFEVPQSNNIYNRRDVYVDYLMVYNPINYEDFAFVGSPTYFKDIAVPKTILKLRNDYEENTKITYAFVRTDTFNEQNPSGAINNFAIMTPVVSYGGQNALVFTFGFDDNILAGVGLYKDSAGNIYNYPVKYTDDRGFFNELWFGMGSSYSQTDVFELDPNGPIVGEDYFNKESTYPLIKDGDNVDLGQTFYIHAGETREDSETYNPLICHKDASSDYHLSYQVSIIPHDFNEYILGQYFFTNNPLVNEMEEKDYLYLYKYTDGTKYRKFDDLSLLDGDYETPVLLSTSNTNYLDGVFTFSGTAEITSSHTSWAIADKYGNLYMACNKHFNGFKFVLRHIRPDTLIIGNKYIPPEEINIREYIDEYIYFAKSASGYKGTINSGTIDEYLYFDGSANGSKGTYYESPIDGYLYFEGIASGAKGIYYEQGVEGYMQFEGVADGAKGIFAEATIDDYLQFDASAIGSKALLQTDSVSGYLQFDASASGTKEYVYDWTVTFLDHDATVLKVEEVTNGGSATPPSDPTRVGYTFDSWSGTYTNVIQDEVVVATYTANQYTVYFNENGGGAVLDKTVTYGSTYGTLPTPTQSGWTFLGWFTSTAYTTQVTSGTVVTTANNHTLYAHWARYYWSSGGSSPVGGNSCSSSNDVGNIVCDTGVVGCSWNPIGISYTSTTDVSSNSGSSCMSTAYKTECVLTTPPSYGWVAGGSALTPSQLCSTASHVGNVRGEVVSCSWGSIINTYFSPTDVSTFKPNCYTDSTRTVCTNVGGNWLCEVTTANRTYGNFETCTLVTQAEYTCTDYEAVQEFGYVSCSKCEVTYK